MYQATGLEPSPDACTWAQQHDRPTQQGSWPEAAPAWDVISLHDVFEHLTCPHDCLEHLMRCLTPGGVLIIEMPEWDSPHQRQEGWQWRHIKPRSHLCLYSRAGAEALFEQHGLQVDAFWRPLRGSLGKAVWALHPV